MGGKYIPKDVLAWQSFLKDPKLSVPTSQIGLAFQHCYNISIT